jgi:hypothetical protein
LGYFDVKYSIAFAPDHAVPVGGKIIVSFPAGQFSLSASFPVPTCSFSALEATDASVGITCVITSDTVTVTGFKAIPTGGALAVNVHGVKNPTSGVTATGNFAIEARSSAGGLIDQKLDVAGFTYTAAYTKGDCRFSFVGAFPNNEKLTSEYTVSLAPATRIPAGGQIAVTFPSA